MIIPAVHNQWYKIVIVDTHTIQHSKISIAITFLLPLIFTTLKFILKWYLFQEIAICSVADLYVSALLMTHSCTLALGFHVSQCFLGCYNGPHLAAAHLAEPQAAQVGTMEQSMLLLINNCDVIDIVKSSKEIGFCVEFSPWSTPYIQNFLKDFGTGVIKGYRTFDSVFSDHRMANTSQTACWNVFYCLKTIAFWFQFNSFLFLWLQLAISYLWLRSWFGAVRPTGHYLNQR